MTTRGLDPDSSGSVELTGMCTVCGRISAFVVLYPEEPYEVCDFHAQETLNGHDVTLEG